MKAARKLCNVSYIVSVVFHTFFTASVGFAELKIDSVHPARGELGRDLEVTLTGSGFDENTRVSMSIDAGNRRAIIGSVATCYDAIADFIVSDGKAFLACGGYEWSGLRVIDISDPASPQIIGSVETPGSARSVTISGGKAFLATWSGGLQVIDISDPAAPQVIGSVKTPAGCARGVAILYCLCPLKSKLSP